MRLHNKIREILMRSLFTAFLSTTTLVSSAFSAPFTEEQTKALELTIEETLLKKPEIIEKTLIKIQEKREQEHMAKAKEAIAKYNKDLFNNESDPVGGNPDGDVSLVIFMDPFCGHCRNFHKVLQEAEKEGDLKNARLIYKDFPIMGKPSVLAVFGALAAHKQGKYLDFQKAMFSAERDLTEEKIYAVAKKLGLNMDQFKKDFKSKDNEERIQKTFELAQNIGIQGTPAIILQDSFIPGAVDREGLKTFVKSTPKTEKVLHNNNA